FAAGRAVLGLRCADRSSPRPKGSARPLIRCDASPKGLGTAARLHPRGVRCWPSGARPPLRGSQLTLLKGLGKSQNPQIERIA
ncbi:MAG: hypothetical protein AAFZ58_17465, partial [Pseudomonadota bacterium]